MTGLTSRRGQLQALLWAIALHSVAVGVGLVLHPADLLAVAHHRWRDGGRRFGLG